MHRKSQYRRPQAQKITTLTNIEIGQIRHREYFKYLPIVLSNVYLVQEFRGRYSFLFQTQFINISEQNRLPYISYTYQSFSHNLVSLNIHIMLSQSVTFSCQTHSNLIQHCQAHC